MLEVSSEFSRYSPCRESKVEKKKNMSSSVVFPPTTVPERTVSFLKNFFHPLDDETPEGAEAFGHLFSEDATYHLSPVLVYRGRPGKLLPRIEHYPSSVSD